MGKKTFLFAVMFIFFTVLGVGVLSVHIVSLRADER